MAQRATFLDFGFWIFDLGGFFAYLVRIYSFIYIINIKYSPFVIVYVKAKMIRV